MPTYLVTHHFPQDFQGSPETAAAATAWFERLGANLVSRSDARFESRQFGSCATDSRLRAYTVISTETLEETLDLAQAWPLLTRGGGVEVRELSALPMVPRASA
jgi:hypothetical protein